MLTDTTAEAEQVQLQLFRRASMAERLGLALALSTTAIQLSRRAIARANPRASDQQLDLIFIELHYGPRLAHGVRERLQQR